VSTYCPYPFKHVFAEPKGIKPCCSYTNIFPGTIQDWLGSDELKQLQDDVLNDRYNDGCIACLQGSATDNFSSRETAFKEYGKIRYNKTEIDFVDFRSSNVCNFKCRSCEPSYSSKIAAEVRRNPKLEKYYTIDNLLPQEHNEQWILNNLNNLKRIMFTGGEPTQIPAVKAILLEIERRGLFNIDIQIISNASFTDQFWIDVTSRLPNINWALSIDACGAEAEIIRHGTKWETVAKNVEILFKTAKSVNIGTVVTVLNVLHLAELFWFANHMKRFSSGRGGDQTISICNFPKYFSPYNWPDGSKPYVIERLEQAYTDANQDSQRQTLDTLIKNIKETPYDFMSWGRFLSHNEALDNIRNEDFIKQLITVPISV